MKCKNCNYFKYDDSIYEYICDASLDKMCTDSDCHCNRLILPIKKKWFDMILSGEKKEEYREIKPYYTTRFTHAFLLKEPYVYQDWSPITVIFRNGYSSDSPSFVARTSLSIDEGNPEWGAELGVKYYVLHIEEIVSTYKCEAGLQKESEEIEYDY